MKTRFSLTPSNMFYAAIVSAFFVGQYLMFAEKNAYQTGALAGRITSLVMFPLVAAVAVWFLFRRHVRRSSITFNTVLTLVAIAHFHTVSNEQPPSPRFEGMNELQEMHAHKDEFKKSALATNDPADYADAYWKFSESVQETFDTLSEKSTGTDQQIFKTLGEFFEGTQAAARQWMNAYNAVLEPSILDYSLLVDDAEFDRQERVLTEYVEQTKVYQINLDKMLPSLKERLSIYDDDNEVVKGVLKGATRKFRSRIVILNPLLDAHIDQGHTLLQMLAFLRVNRDKWTYENDELIIDSDDLLDEYDTLIETLTQLQEKTENLSRQATEEL